MSTTFEDILNKAKDAAQAAGKKTGDFIDITKMKMEISKLEKEMGTTYEGLGRLTYDAKKGGEESADLMDSCVEHIDELTGQVQKLREKVAEAQNAVRCSACGTLNDQDAHFCKKCGGEL